MQIENKYAKLNDRQAALDDEKEHLIEKVVIK
jgi:hypothetical protein